MDWQIKMNQVLDYIEESLLDEVNLETLAKFLFCSVWEFQRLFSFVTHMSLGEYIRMRRLSLAAVDIQANKDKITNIANKYRYDSHAAFTRAFNRQYGMSPSSARNSKIILKKYPKITIKIYTEVNNANEIVPYSENIENYQKFNSPCGLDCLFCPLYDGYDKKMSDEWVKRFCANFNIRIDELPCKNSN